MNNTDILEEDVKNILNCCTDIETLISLDERAKEDLKNNTHNIQQQEVLTIIREFIRCKNDCSTLIAEKKELKEKNKRQQENLKIANKKIAAQRGQLMMLNKAYIPKSKVEELLKEIEKEGYFMFVVDRDKDIAIEYVQSLLGKE